MYKWAEVHMNQKFTTGIFIRIWVSTKYNSTESNLFFIDLLLTEVEQSDTEYIIERWRISFNCLSQFPEVNVTAHKDSTFSRNHHMT